MSLFTGRLVEVGIGKETSRGTGVAASYWMPKTAISFDDKVSKALTSGSYGFVSDAPFTGQVVGKWAEGDIEGELNANSFGLILLALCGTESYSLAETGVGQHDYSIQNDVQSDSLTIHISDPIGAVKFRMAMVNSLTLDVALGEFVKYTANFISKFHQDEAAQTATYQVDYRFTHPNLTFKVAANVGGIAAATAISVKSLSLTIDKNVERQDVLGTIEPEDILNKGFRITGSIELRYEDRTWRDYMLNGNVKAMQVLLTGSQLIGATQYAKLDMQFDKVHFFEWEPSRDLGDIASQKINFEVMFNLSATRLWGTFQLLNGVTAAY